ncbi:maleylpyruvate isomerase N-terminal domain-containing protein [Mycolicibacterium komossense]|uniref:Maleylpyruvate isomerase N-terminal domain-containing protein n=1 Tax=Mycolicibacterium komossense TaxID=1779 RepID=A0ABT3C6M2_9MYCO|nr:maleylpyruvate isomerase N-terminal domain-containing protein [Mycolicibacterium komossense]MCV7225133.1 maleylpyruvate isomerase N-terminal domain-containing protein [Mycolicibacterium komossense]
MGPQPLFNDLEITDRLSIVADGQTWLTGYLDALGDDGFDGPSLLPDWKRRHVIAHIGYNARGLGRLVDWATTGIETPMYPSAQARATEIDEGAQASPCVLREFVAASAAELTAKWRVLPWEAWQATVRVVSGAEVPASATLWMRAKEVWIHTVDLGTGATFAEFPRAVLNQLLTDIPETPLTGPAAGVVRWATGRGADELETAPDFDPPAWM